jgi:predicted nuclease of predicted toxin-antitoxin system
VAGDRISPLYIRLYIDEHVWRKLAAELRERGFDAVNVYDAGRTGLSDEEQWEYAAIQERAFLTFDKDGGRFVTMASEWFYAGRLHYGLIVSAQLERGELLRRVLRLLDAVTADEMMNTVRFLEEFK